MQRGIVTGVAALALASAAGTAAAGPVRMCDGDRGVIAKEVSCAHALWLADYARAGEQPSGWAVQANSAGVVRLRRGKAWVKVRRVPRRAVAELLIAGLSVTYSPPPADDGSSESDTLTLCAGGLMEGVASGRSGSSAGPAWGVSALFDPGTWSPAYAGEWRGGRTLELDVRMRREGEWMGLAWAQRVRLELRDDGTGTLTSAAGRRAVTWSRASPLCGLRKRP